MNRWCASLWPAACTILLTLASLGCEEADQGPVLKPAEITQGPHVFEGIYYGELIAAKSTDIHVPDIPDTWQVTVDSVKPDGELVKQGDVILTFVRETFELDLRDENDKLEMSQAERLKVVQQLDKERIDLDLDVKRKQLNLERAKLQVVEGVNFISGLELDKAKIDVEKAQLELELANKALRTFEQKRASALKIEDLKIEAAQRKVDNKKRGLELIEITAPVDGMLYAPYTRLNWQRTKVAPGIVARPGDKILEIPDLTKYHAQLYVRQRDAALIKVGDEATITPLILPDKPIAGRVIKKDDFATTRNERFDTETSAGNLKEYLITVELDEAPQELRPGNSAKVHVRATLSPAATLLPVGYAYKKPDNSWAVRLAGGQEQPVKLGRTNLSHVEVLEGLKVGQQVELLPDAL